MRAFRFVPLARNDYFDLIDWYEARAAGLGDRFADVFAAFAIQTFDENKVEFSESDAIGHLNKAKQMKPIKFSSVDFLMDSKKSVCLIMEDGLKLRFSHRSFQEYFAAYFIVNANCFRLPSR